MRGGFLEGLEQGIERFPGQHVHLVDDEDAIRAQTGSVLDMLDQTTDIIDAPMGCAVHLGDIGIFSAKDLFASGTLIAGDSIFSIGALQCPRKDPCHRGLTHSTRPTEKISVSETVLQDRLP